MADVDVREFIDRMARLGWDDGQRDCLLWLGLWTEEAVGIDGGGEWRGRYRTPLGRERVLRRSGGMLACISRGAERAGLIEGRVPHAGAVGLIRVDTERGPGEVGAIFNGLRWCALTPDGVLSVRTTPVCFWNLP
jgi:hypothetical protein